MSKFNHKKILPRYKIIAYCIVLISIAVLAKAAYIGTVKRDYWMKVASRLKKDSVDEGAALVRSLVRDAPDAPGARYGLTAIADAYLDGGRYAEASSAERPELAKEFAIRDFVEHVFHVLKRTGGLGRPVSVGFSDDDAGNVKAVSDYIRCELVKRFKGFKFVVYDTSDASLDNGRKVTVAGQLTLPGF